MSDDDVLKRLDERAFVGNLYEQAAARIRELRDLLDECEKALAAAGVWVESSHAECAAALHKVNATLAKLRTQ